MKMFCILFELPVIIRCLHILIWQRNVWGDLGWFFSAFHNDIAHCNATYSAIIYLMINKVPAEILPEKKFLILVRN